MSFPKRGNEPYQEGQDLCSRPARTQGPQRSLRWLRCLLKVTGLEETELGHFCLEKTNGELLSSATFNCVQIISVFCYLKVVEDGATLYEGAQEIMDQYKKNI